MQNDELKYKLHLIIGVNSCGKTTYVRKNFLDRTNQRVLLLNPTGEPKWKDYGQIELKEIRTFTGKKQIIPKIDWENISKSYIPAISSISANYYGGILVIDDCREIIQANLQMQCATLMRSYRQHQWQLVTIFHSINQVPPMIFENCKGYIYLFQTQDNLQKVKAKIPTGRAPEIISAMERVNHASKQNPHAMEIIKL